MRPAWAQCPPRPCQWRDVLPGSPPDQPLRIAARQAAFRPQSQERIASPGKVPTPPSGRAFPTDLLSVTVGRPRSQSPFYRACVTPPRSCSAGGPDEGAGADGRPGAGRVRERAAADGGVAGKGAARDRRRPAGLVGQPAAEDGGVAGEDAVADGARPGVADAAAVPGAGGAFANAPGP